MNWKNVLILGGVTVGGIVLLGRMFSNNLLISFQRMRWLGLDGLNLRLALVYQLDNRNDIPATVSRLEGKILYGDYKMNDLVIDQPVTVEPGGKENVEVKFTVKPGVLLSELLRLFDENKGFKKFRLTGWVSGKMGSVPFKIPMRENLELAS